MSTPDPAPIGRTRHPACAPAAGTSGSRIPPSGCSPPLLDLSGERWDTSRSSSRSSGTSDGSPVSGFRPDFYLPERGVFVELTTADQRLVTRKNRKVRRMRALYPEVPIHVVYQRDFTALLASHGLAASSPPEPLSLTRWTARTWEATTRLRVSPLHAAHVAFGAKMVPFGGWEMPLAYQIGHRGRAPGLPQRRGRLRREPPGHGPACQGHDAFEHLQRSFSNDLRKVHPGRAQYTHLLDRGRLRRRRHHRVVGRRRAFRRHAQRLEHRGGYSTPSEEWMSPTERAVARRAGPRGQGAACRRWRPPPAGGPRFDVTRLRAGRGATCLVAGTGYTGEDGVECAVPPRSRRRSGRPCWPRASSRPGLGARDTLRLEAGLPLHGHELGPGITPLQAGLGWVVGWDKGDFPGRAALEEERASGPRPPAPGFRGRRAPAAARRRRGVRTAPRQVGS